LIDEWIARDGKEQERAWYCCVWPDHCVFHPIVTVDFRGVTGHFKNIVTGDFRNSVTGFG